MIDPVTQDVPTETIEPTPVDAGEFLRAWDISFGHVAIVSQLWQICDDPQCKMGSFHRE